MSNLNKVESLSQVRTVQQMLMTVNARDQLGMVAAKHLNPEAMMRVMAFAVMKTPNLKECHPMSLLGAMMTCAQLGLMPNTPQGHAYLIPFKNRKKGIMEVNLILGYRGLMDLAMRSGKVLSITSAVHYAGDPVWTYREGTNRTLDHVPGDDDSDPQHAYAVAFLAGEGKPTEFEVMPWRRIMAIRDNSQGYKQAVQYGRTDNPWQTHPAAMARKTAIRALSKKLPMSLEYLHGEMIDGARVDYGNFAMNPEDPIQIGDDDPEMIEQDKPAAAPAARQTRKKAEPAAAQEKPSAQAQAAPVQDQVEVELAMDDEGEAQNVTAEETDAGKHKLYQEVLDYIADGIPVETIRHGIEGQIPDAPANVVEAINDLLEQTLALQDSEDAAD